MPALFMRSTYLIAGLDDARAHGGGGLARALAHQFLAGQARHLDVDVDPVEQGTTDFREIAPDLVAVVSRFK